MSELERYFRLEASELLEVIEDGLARGDARAVLRAAHTLKGAASVINLGSLVAAAHAIEEALAPYERVDAPPATTDALTAAAPHVLHLRAYLEGAPATSQAREERPARGPGPGAQPGKSRISERQTSGAPKDLASSANPLQAVEDESVRVRLSSLHALLQRADDTRRQLEPLGELAASLSRLARTAEAQAAAPNPKALRALAASLRQAAARSSEGLRSADHAVDQLWDRAKGVRLLSARMVIDDLERAVAGASQQLGVQVRFRSSGEALRLDAQVLLVLRGALRHLVRNAISHGVARRTHAEPGQVSVHVERGGHLARWTVQDDGPGLDLEALAAQARARGLLSAGEALGMDRALALLIHGDMQSTRASADLISGRGVGLGAVASAVKSLGGTLSATSSSRGTAFSVEVPLSLTALPVLRLEVAGREVLLPQAAALRVVRVEFARLHASKQGCSFSYEGRLLPVVRLSTLLGWAESEPEHASLVIVEGARGPVALAATRVVGLREAIVSQLPSSASGHSFLAGATLGARGAPLLVLEPRHLTSDQAQRTASPLVEVQRPPVLVIDDSLTTRMVQRGVLESAGYEVDLAISAEEALERAAIRDYGLFLVDVEMPGMNGFEFVERTRADERLAQVPAILLTTRGAAEDRQRGLNAGAHAYLIKSEFDEQVLLRAVRELIG